MADMNMVQVSLEVSRVSLHLQEVWLQQKTHLTRSGAAFKHNESRVIPLVGYPRYDHHFFLLLMGVLELRMSY